MQQEFHNAYLAGLERMTAWSALLDRINVFPVADGDTGRNLVVSLSPLRRAHQKREDVIRALRRSACGNSGNIAVCFFAELIKAESEDQLIKMALDVANAAWQAVQNPRKGTMLSVFDALAEILALERKLKRDSVSTLIDHLAESVRKTHFQLPELREAGVVDAGALGMFIYLEGFFNCLCGSGNELRPVTQRFKERLTIADAFQPAEAQGHCINAVVQTADADSVRELLSTGDSVIESEDDEELKLHLHADDRNAMRRRLESRGRILSWSDEDLEQQVRSFQTATPRTSLHIMTDAAGSLTVEDAAQRGFTLLNSYIITSNEMRPETLVNAPELYHYMKQGGKVSTAQASRYERFQSYESVVNQYGRVLYLCVGSVYTGNYAAAMAWKQNHDPDDRLMVIDTGAASGRLALIVMAALDYLDRNDKAAEVVAFAQKIVEQSTEYIFLDRLQYLAAGGRLSKSSAFMGDLLHVKPVITPAPEGAKKVGAVRNCKAQIRFALARLSSAFDANQAPFILLEYTDNKEWVADTVQKRIQERHPRAEIKLQPMSLTSGVHMGPGTWGLAFLNK